MTIGEAISRVRNQIKAVKQDAHLTDRFLYSIIMKHARFFMHRQDNLNRIMKYNSLFQTIHAYDLIDVDVAEAECHCINTGCKIKRTREKLPKMMEGYYGPLFRTISSVDLSKLILPTFPMTFKQISKQSTFKYNKKKYYWFLNGHLYFPNIDWDAVRIEGVFEHDVNYLNCEEPDDCVFIQNMNINIPEFLFSEIEQLVSRDLGIMIQIPSDPGQNAGSLTN